MNTIEYVIARIRQLLTNPAFGFTCTNVTIEHKMDPKVEELHHFMINNTTTVLLDTSDLALHLFEIDKLIEPQLEIDEFNSRVGTDVPETARARFQRRVRALVDKQTTVYVGKLSDY